MKIIFLYRVEAYCNYVDLILEPGKGLFQYEIKFSPNIDSVGLRRKLLNQHSAALGRTRIFDGTLLYLPIKLFQDVSLRTLIENFYISTMYVILYDV